MSVNWDERFIELARHVASWSKDPSTKVGAVAVDAKRRVRSLGYNGFPRGIADDERLNDRQVKYLHVVHAEANAILNAPLGVEGCTMYLTLAPCSSCAKLLIQAGVARVVAATAAPERWGNDCMLAASMLGQAGVAYQIGPQ